MPWIHMALLEQEVKKYEFNACILKQPGYYRFAA
jgi:hypothetical protein